METAVPTSQPDEWRPSVMKATSRQHLTHCHVRAYPVPFTTQPQWMDGPGWLGFRIQSRYRKCNTSKRICLDLHFCSQLDDQLFKYMNILVLNAEICMSETAASQPSRARWCGRVGDSCSGHSHGVNGIHRMLTKMEQKFPAIELRISTHNHAFKLGVFHACLSQSFSFEQQDASSVTLTTRR